MLIKKRKTIKKRPLRVKKKVVKRKIKPKKVAKTQKLTTKRRKKSVISKKILTAEGWKRMMRAKMQKKMNK